MNTLVAILVAAVLTIVGYTVGLTGFILACKAVERVIDKWRKR